MTIDELSRYAINEKHPPPHMEPYDELLWYKLRDIYRDFKSGTISQEVAASSKACVINIRNKQADAEEARIKQSKRFSDFWSGIEAAGVAYMKSPSIETADAFLESVYRVGRLNKSQKGDHNGSI